MNAILAGTNFKRSQTCEQMPEEFQASETSASDIVHLLVPNVLLRWFLLAVYLKKILPGAGTSSYLTKNKK
jgi:nucleoside recognition membrane protein YjiH